jgi:hypothetical protein
MNSTFKIITLVAGCWLLAASLGCHKQTTKTTQTIRNFPPQMVGAWEAGAGILETQKWQIQFESDGTVSKINHHVFGMVTISEGGMYKDGPDPGTYMVFTLGPVEAEYDSASNMIKVKIVIEDYEMKFPEGGKLQGRMLDTLMGAASKDGQSWEVEWRSYGWLEGAQDPDIDYIDKNPEKIVFRKMSTTHIPKVNS